jgi:hypothetical protein
MKTEINTHCLKMQTTLYIKKYQELGMQLSGRALAWHLQSFGFDPQHCTTQNKQQQNF